MRQASFKRKRNNSVNSCCETGCRSHILTRITGLQANSILQIISEVGINMNPFPTAKHFVAYLGFAPRPEITGRRKNF
ncbi:MAG: IS110 family transposase [Tannerellaceae bacterium]|nr:IS110 family transposase [Tannerellaceae bacterium]